MKEKENKEEKEAKKPGMSEEDVLSGDGLSKLFLDKKENQ